MLSGKIGFVMRPEAKAKDNENDQYGDCVFAFKAERGFFWLFAVF